MTARNDITGAPIKTRANNKAYDEGWDRIFGKKEEPDDEKEELTDEEE